MKIVENLFFDWLYILKKRLIANGINTDGLCNKEIVSAYFNLQIRLIPARPRKIYRSKNFSIPSQFESDLCALEKIITTGGDLTPYLSRQISKFQKKDKVDKILSDWRIHHFHFRPEGTKELLFAIVDDINFYEIGVFNHNSWYDTTITTLIKENWPDLVKTLPFKSEISYTPNMVKQMRNVNIFTPTLIGGWLTILGDGLTTGGHNVKAEELADIERYKIKDILEKIPSITCIPSFIKENDIINFKLVDKNGKIYVKSIFTEEESGLI